MDIVKKTPNTTIDLFNIVNTQVKQFINDEGNAIYRQNEYFKDLHDMMQDKKFRVFYNKYYKDWGEIKVMMMYMKLYENIEKEYFIKYNKKISKEMVLYIVREIIRNRETRKITLLKFREFEHALSIETAINKQKNVLLPKHAKHIIKHKQIANK